MYWLHFTWYGLFKVNRRWGDNLSGPASFGSRHEKHHCQLALQRLKAIAASDVVVTWCGVQFCCMMGKLLHIDIWVSSLFDLLQFSDTPQGSLVHIVSAKYACEWIKERTNICFLFFFLWQSAVSVTGDLFSSQLQNPKNLSHTNTALWGRMQAASAAVSVQTEQLCHNLSWTGLWV